MMQQNGRDRCWRSTSVDTAMHGQMMTRIERQDNDPQWAIYMERVLFDVFGVGQR